MLHSTARRVQSHIDRDINRRIAEHTERNIQYFAAHPEKIEERLADLDREWDIERALEANAAALGVAGVTLGIAGRKLFFLLPGLVGAFLLQHALQGWCPPLPLLRRLGFRTAAEIEREGNALKAIRGDFVKMTSTDPDEADPKARGQAALDAVDCRPAALRARDGARGRRLGIAVRLC